MNRSRRIDPPDVSVEAAAPLTPFVPTEFAARLARWYRANARQLPWRGVRDPYAIWVSEIMLQQTRVATVIERFGEFLRRFPDLFALAAASEDDVLALWSGLGYYRRARLLHRGAQFVVRELDGKLPRQAAALRTLPGVGEYTAAAIASIAFRQSVAVVDGNVERVLLRVMGWGEDRSGSARARLTRIAQSLVPGPPSRNARFNPPGDHNQAMMELGATVCLPQAPLCLQCPVFDFCATRGEHATAARDKPQSRTVAHLLSLRKRGVISEVLLERRPATVSLMPGMLELPEIPVAAADGREPVLRLRHSITNTSYYVLVFAEASPGVAATEPDNENALQDTAGDEADPGVDVAAEQDRAASEAEIADDLPGYSAGDAPLEGRGPAGAAEGPGALVDAVVSGGRELFWCPAAALFAQPLTGLARKTLQRIGVMAVPRPWLSGQPPPEQE